MKQMKNVEITEEWGVFVLNGKDNALKNYVKRVDIDLTKGVAPPT